MCIRDLSYRPQTFGLNTRVYIGLWRWRVPVFLFLMTKKKGWSAMTCGYSTSVLVNAIIPVEGQTIVRNAVPKDMYVNVLFPFLLFYNKKVLHFLIKMNCAIFVRLKIIVNVYYLIKNQKFLHSQQSTWEFQLLKAFCIHLYDLQNDA